MFDDFQSYAIIHPSIPSILLCSVMVRYKHKKYNCHLKVIDLPPVEGFSTMISSQGWNQAVEKTIFNFFESPLTNSVFDYLAADFVSFATESLTEYERNYFNFLKSLLKVKSLNKNWYKILEDDGFIVHKIFA